MVWPPNGAGSIPLVPAIPAHRRMTAMPASKRPQAGAHFARLGFAVSTPMPPRTGRSGKSQVQSMKKIGVATDVDLQPRST